MTLAMPRYDTNLAAEFHVLSVLHRLGANANLTLGNKKAVDIVVIRAAGDTITIDVKGVAGKSPWLINNVPLDRERHFLVLVSFLDRISDISSSPEVYVIPSTRLAELRSARGLRGIRLATVRRVGREFRDAWSQLL
jgi:hypothetical protein